MSEILTVALVGGFFGSFFTGLISLFIAWKNNTTILKLEQERKTQDYRRELMTQYIDTVSKFHQIAQEINLFITEDKIGGKISSTEEKTVQIAHLFSEMQLTVIKAASILRASGDMIVLGYGWSLSQEALSITELSDFVKASRGYNIQHFFRITLD
ncbi:MAG: hypothetical protein WBC91_20420, partial [Phototrophicaceae bacterium]